MSDLSSRIHATWPSPSNESLPELCNTLLSHQQSAWPQLTSGYASLREIQTREVQCDGYSVTIQYNPKRLVSTGAKVDAHSVAGRRCFLCVENLPTEQKGVLFRDEFLILCNPAPIFQRHFTIAHLKHIPQAIEAWIPTLVDLAKALSPSSTVFYNGPKCGASAPDHLHFQASPKGAIPIEQDASDPSRLERRKTIDTVTVSTVKHTGRQTIIVEGNDAESFARTFSRLISAVKQVLHVNGEPMINVLCSYSEGLWRMIVFLRRKHRPDVFFKEGDEQILISPAAVDVGGLIIAPVEKDFKRIDAAMVQSIYDEVVLDKKAVDLIVNSL